VALAVSILPAQISLKSGYLASYTLGDPVDFGQIIQMPNELIVGRQEFQLFWKDGAGQWQAITPLIINYRASEFGITRPGTYHFTVSSSPEGTDPVEFDLTFTRK
jgi:hypothetical protein